MKQPTINNFCLPTFPSVLSGSCQEQSFCLPLSFSSVCLMGARSNLLLHPFHIYSFYYVLNSSNLSCSLRFQILMVASMQMRAFWDIVPCSLTGVDRRQSIPRLHGVISPKALIFSCSVYTSDLTHYSGLRFYPYFIICYRNFISAACNLLTSLLV
jgi:hypothetical protein